MKKQKYYVVWIGLNPGVYSSWDDAKKQIEGHPNAKYKSFPSREVAEKAFNDSYLNHISQNNKNTSQNIPKFSSTNIPKGLIQDSIAVDAACSGNPGLMEYRGVVTISGEQIFHQGPFKEGTNNIGEFLALVHAIALLKKNSKEKTAIYTDSKIAMLWVKNKKAKTKVQVTSKNQPIIELIARAENWLRNNTYSNPIIKWPTDKWGEIPADFGRK